MVSRRKTWLFLFVCSGALVQRAMAQSRNAAAPPVEQSLQEFRDVAAGVTAADLVRRALVANAELAASRQDVGLARARRIQAGLMPNPSAEAELTTGRWTTSAGERERSIGVSIPIELGGKRGKRIDLTEANIAAAEAEVADRERRLATDVRTAFAEAMSALRELEITADLSMLDRETIQFVEARVGEGDAPPLELSLLRADADRLLSRRALVQGKLEAAILRLKSLTGTAMAEVLRFREDLRTASLPAPPSLDAALQTAMTTRPDLRFARLNEEVAAAGLKLARAQAIPDLLISTRYSTNTGVIDRTPVGVIQDRDKLLSVRASVSVPIFNRNQGVRAEAETSILQARLRREFIETLVRAEVAAAYSRYLSARDAVEIYEPGVLSRSEDNIRAVRGAYEIGAFRITDLLNERRRQVDFQREYTEALAERYRALADLHAAMGTPVNP